MKNNPWNRTCLAALLALCGGLMPGTLPAQSAEETVALAQMANMAQAMEIEDLDTNYYVSPENLNDLGVPSTSPPYDSILDQGGVYVLTPSTGQFSATRKNLTIGALTWKGPYVTYQQDQVQTDTTPYDQGSLLDPWGSPFYLFSPLGLVRGDTGKTTLELYGDAFDRYTFVSLGPDGVKSGDDLAYQFGVGLTSFAISSLSGDAVHMTSGPGVSPAEWTMDAGTTVAIRGINLGGSDPGNQVLFDSQPLANILSWQNRQIVVSVPENTSGTGSIIVRKTGQESNPLALTVIQPDSVVKGWWAY